MNDKKEERLYHWAMMSVFSAVVLGSAVDTFSNPSSRQKWGISCAAVTMAIGAIVSVFYKMKPDLIGSRIEGGLACVVLVLWIVNLPFYRGEIFLKEFELSSLIANMYYFSWAALFTSVHLTARLLFAEFEWSEQVKKRFTHWSMLFSFNLVVMVTSSYNFRNKQGMDDQWCRLTLLAIIIGAVTSFKSLATMFLLSTTILDKWQSKIECLSSLINTALYAVTIGFINGTEGPGGRIGNLYYSMWFSFVTSTLLTLECCNDLWMEWKEPEAEKEKDAGTVGDDEHHQEQEKETQEVQAQDENVAENV